MPVSARARVVVEPIYEVFGARFRKARTERGLTLEGAAKLISRTPGHVSEVEAGRCRVTLHAAVRLAEAVGMSLTELTAPSARRARLEALADE